jgi:2-keto-4-pentenoate hydratase/2-oxohepta-3-ene-1,7-dioic acid hydratase in catechol pathway
MKIICVGRNYADHIKELGNATPTEPILFMKPASAILRESKPFYIPAFTQNVHYEGEIVLRIAKNGKHVAPKFAATYYDQYTIGIDFTARDVQDRLKANGHPWEIAKAFDGSAILGDFLPIADLPNKNSIKFELHKNNTIVQTGDTRDLIFDFDTLICHISRYFTLHTGDLVFTGTPAGVGAVAIGDALTGFVEGKKLLYCEIK